MFLDILQIWRSLRLKTKTDPVMIYNQQIFMTFLLHKLEIQNCPFARGKQTYICNVMWYVIKLIIVLVCYGHYSFTVLWQAVVVSVVCLCLQHARQTKCWNCWNSTPKFQQAYLSLSGGGTEKQSEREWLGSECGVGWLDQSDQISNRANPALLTKLSAMNRLEWGGFTEELGVFRVGGQVGMATEST